MKPTPRSLLICSLAAAVVPASGAFAAAEFTPRLNLGLTWTDNVLLAPPGGNEESEWIWQLIPGFAFGYTGTRFHANLDYQWTGLFYMNDSDRNLGYHTATVGLGAELVPKWFFLDLAGTYDQHTITPERPVDQNLLFETNNVADVATYNITPYIKHDFQKATLEIRYAMGWVDYTDEDPLGQVVLDDSDNTDFLFTFHSPDEDDARLTWGLSYESEEANYEVSQSFVYDNATAELGWRLSRSFRVFGQGGKETDLNQGFTDGGLDEPWWSAGFDWTPGQGNRLTISGGERFYGHTFGVTAERRARLLVLHASYVEEPTTAAQQLAFKSAPTSTEATGVRPEDLNRQTGEVYLRKDFDAGVAIQGNRTTIDLYLLDHRREYLSSGLEDKEKGGGASVRRQLSSRMNASASFSLQDFQTREGGDGKDMRITLSLDRQIGPDALATFEIAHLERSGSSGTDEYDVNYATARVSKKF